MFPSVVSYSNGEPRFAHSRPMVLRLSPVTDNRRINAAAYGNDIDEIHSRFDDVNRSPINRYRRVVMTERSNAQTGPSLQRYNIVIITIIIYTYVHIRITTLINIVV